MVKENVYIEKIWMTINIFFNLIRKLKKIFNWLIKNNKHYPILGVGIVTSLTLKKYWSSSIYTFSLINLLISLIEFYLSLSLYRRKIVCTYILINYKLKNSSVNLYLPLFHTWPLSSPYSSPSTSSSSYNEWWIYSIYINYHVL